MKKRSEFDQGYACAIACIVSSHDPGLPCEEALSANGMTSIAALRAAGVDSNDIEILRPTIKRMRANERYRKTAALRAGEEKHE